MHRHTFLLDISQKINIYNKTISNKTKLYFSYMGFHTKKNQHTPPKRCTTAIYYFCLSNIFAWIIGCVIPDFVIFLVLCSARKYFIFIQIQKRCDAFLPPEKYNRKSYNAIRKLCSYMIYILNPTFSLTHTHTMDFGGMRQIIRLAWWYM